MTKIKRFVIVAVIVAFTLPLALAGLTGCGGDHHHHDLTTVPLPR